MCPSFSESRLLGEGAPPAICMDIKTKELLNLHFVSVRKQREGLAIDNRWDLLPLCFLQVFSVDSKQVRGACWRKGNRGERADSGWLRRTGRREAMGGKGKIMALA